MLKSPTRTVLLLSAALLGGSVTSTLAEMAPPAQAPAKPAKMANGLTSPTGEKHPGEVAFDDKIEKRTYTRRAGELVLGSAWVKVGDTWKAVVRTEITGTPERKTFTRYGTDGKVLEKQEFTPRPKNVPLPPT